MPTLKEMLQDTVRGIKSEASIKMKDRALLNEMEARQKEREVRKARICGTTAPNVPADSASKPLSKSLKKSANFFD